MGKHVSAVWMSFDRDYHRDGSPYSKCLVRGCGVVLKYHAASNAKRHLLTAHKIDVHSVDARNRAANPSSTDALKREISDLCNLVSNTRVGRVSSSVAHANLFFRSARLP